MALVLYYAVGGMGSVILGRSSIADQVTFNPAIPMQVVVCDLDTLSEVRRFTTDPGAIIHFGNAYERGDEIIVDGMFTDNFEANDTLSNVFDPDGRFGGGRYLRYQLNMATGDLSSTQISEHESEFPTFNTTLTGSENRYCYTACSIPNGADSFFNAIQRVDFEGDSTLVTLPPGCYGSEPMFAPATNSQREDDGYVLEVVYDGFKHISELQIYRADNLNERVCTARLRHHVPHQFHGYFHPEVLAQEAQA